MPQQAAVVFLLIGFDAHVPDMVGNTIPDGITDGGLHRAFWRMDDPVRPVGIKTNFGLRSGTGNWKLNFAAILPGLRHADDWLHQGIQSGDFADPLQCIKNLLLFLAELGWIAHHLKAAAAAFG